MSLFFPKQFSNRLIIGVLINFVLIFPIDGWAKSLTLAQALSDSLENNKELKAAYVEFDKLRGNLLQAGLKPNPAVEFSANGDFAFSSDGERNLAIGVAQPIPLAGRLGKAQAVVRIDLAVALAEIRNRERLLIKEVQRRFVEVAALQEQIALREKLLAVGKEFIAISTRRLEVAEGSRVDINSLQIEEDRLKLEKELLGTEKNTRVLELKQLLGMGPDIPLTIVDLTSDLASRFSGRLENSQPPSRRPDLRVFELIEDRSKAEIRLAKAEAWGDLSVGFEYDNERAVFESPINVKKDQFLGLKITIPLPVRNKNEGRIEAQKATAFQAQKQIQARALRVAVEIADATARLEKYRVLAKNYRENVLALSRENLSEIKEAFRQGLIPIGRVIQAQQQSLDLRTAYLDILPKYLFALIDLETATASSPFLKRDYLASTAELGLKLANSKSNDEYQSDL